jgi:hypothetical protein
MVFDSAQDAREPLALRVDQWPVPAMLADEVSRGMFGRQPGHDEQVGIFRQRTQACGPAMIGIGIDGDGWGIP